LNLETIKNSPGAVPRFWQNSRSFFTEVRNELKRVSWPSKTEVYATTFVVILTSIFFGLYLYGIDMALNLLVGWIFRSFGVGA
jgi:preprotein translocase subunit SecE